MFSCVASVVLGDIDVAVRYHMQSVTWLHLVAVQLQVSRCWQCCATNSTVECHGSHFSRCAVSVLFDPGMDMFTYFTIDAVTQLLLPLWCECCAVSWACFTLVLLVGWQAFLTMCSGCVLRCRHGHVYVC